MNILYKRKKDLYNTRKRGTLPSLKHFISLVKDELKLKYRGTRILKYAEVLTEAAAIRWYRGQMGWLPDVPGVVHL